MNRKVLLIFVALIGLAMLATPLASAVPWVEKNNDKFQTFYFAGKFNAFAAIGSADRTYVPSFDNVEKMILTWSESYISFQIKVGDKTYNLHTDFEVSSNSEEIFWNPVFGPTDTSKVFPVASSANHLKAEDTFDFLPASGLVGSFTIQTIVNDGNHRTTSLSGTGDFRNVQIQATVSQIPALPFLIIVNNGLVIG